MVLFELADRALGRLTALTEALHERPRPELAPAMAELEDVYAALMARPDAAKKRAPVKERTEDEFEDELLDEGV